MYFWLVCSVDVRGMGHTTGSTAVYCASCAERSHVHFFCFVFVPDLVFIKPSNWFPVLPLMSTRSWPPSSCSFFFFFYESTRSNKLSLTQTQPGAGYVNVGDDSDVSTDSIWTGTSLRRACTGLWPFRIPLSSKLGLVFCMFEIKPLTQS